MPGFIKANLSDRFAVFMTCGRCKKFFKNTEYARNTQIIYKRMLTRKQIKQFKFELHEFDRAENLASEDMMIS